MFIDIFKLLIIEDMSKEYKLSEGNQYISGVDRLQLVGANVFVHAALFYTARAIDQACRTAAGHSITAVRYS
jgi:hypothetical protein